MPSTHDLADVQWLVSQDADPWLILAADQGAPLHRRAAQLRQALSPARTHLVLELVELRRRGRAKYQLSERLFFTDRGLQQATDQWISTYKAARFPTRERVADLCCGIGGDLMGLAARGPVDGFDGDPFVAIYAEANVRRAAQMGTVMASADCADATRLHLSPYAAWHIDPDRRSGKHRTVDLQHMSPALGAIEQLLSQNEHAAIKLAPATSLPKSWQDQAELEWIGRARECRQLVAWFGRLARSPGTRRATVVDENGTAVAQVSGAAQPLPPPASSVSDYVFEPDPSVLAAGLTGQLAQTHALLPLEHGIPYLTGANLIDDRALGVFRVVAVLPADEKRLGAELRSRGIGRLEIKCRGVPIAPAELRRRLRLQGDRSSVLLVTPQNGQTIAVLAEREGLTPHGSFG